MLYKSMHLKKVKNHVLLGSQNSLVFTKLSVLEKTHKEALLKCFWETDFESYANEYFHCRGSLSWVHHERDMETVDKQVSGFLFRTQ